MLYPGKMASAVWERESAPGPWQLSLQLSPCSLKSGLSLHNSSLLHPSLPENRVSGCKGDFVHWPFKMVPASLPGGQKLQWISQPDVV